MNSTLVVCVRIFSPKERTFFCYGDLWADAMSMGSTMEVGDLQVLLEMRVQVGLDPICWHGVNVACQDFLRLNDDAWARELELVVPGIFAMQAPFFGGVFSSLLLIQLEWIFGPCKK